MCRELDALRQSICDYARAFDTGSLIPADAARVVRLCASIESSIATVKALAAAAVAEGGSWKSEGYRSAEEQLADRTGVGTGAARRALQHGRLMAEQPVVAQAALGGELSVEQAALVAAGAEVDSAKAGELIEKAKSASVGELRDEVAQVRAAKMDLEERRRSIHAARKLRHFVDLDGVWRLMGEGNVADGITLSKVLTPIRQRLDLERRTRGEHRESFDQLYYDALMALADIASGRDGELSLAELLDLGLFSQLESTLAGLTPDPPPTPPRPAPRPDASPSRSGASGRPAAPAAPAAAARAGDCAPPGAPPAPVVAGDCGPSGAPPAAAARAGDCAPQGAPPATAIAGVSGPGGTAASLDGGIPGANPPSLFHPPQSPDGDPSPGGRSAPPPDAPGEDGLTKKQGKSRGRPARKLAGRPVQVIVRVDLDTLLRGVPIEGELCEIAGYGPVPVSVIEDLIANQATFISAVLTKSEAVCGVYRYGRRPTAVQQTALDFLYPTCAAKGCNRKAGLEYEHRKDWAKTHYTVYDHLDRLCWFHHRQKTNDGWQLVEGIGKRDFVPPSDPRHPTRTGGAHINPGVRP